MSGISFDSTWYSTTYPQVKVQWSPKLAVLQTAAYREKEAKILLNAQSNAMQYSSEHLHNTTISSHLLYPSSATQQGIFVEAQLLIWSVSLLAKHWSQSPLWATHRLLGTHEDFMLEASMRIPFYRKYLVLSLVWEACHSISRIFAYTLTQKFMNGL